jgi:chemotaxis protein CheD
VKVAGGGRILDAEGVLDIGARNYTLLRKLFWKNGVIINAEDVGGSRSRTVRLTIGTGRVVIHSQGEESEL